MKKLFLICSVLVITSVLGAACAPATASPAAAATPPAAAPLTVSSADWKLEIKSANWGGDSAMVPLDADQKQLLVFTNLEYVGPEGDVVVPAFGVKDDQSRTFKVFASFGYGNDVPKGGEDWISSFVTGKPATRHFVTGEAFRPLMFTFAGPKDAKSFTFSLGDLSLDFTSVVKTK